MDRRAFVKTSAVGGVALMTVGVARCGGPSITGTITIITGVATELKPLFPNFSDRLDKIIKLATSFNEAWVAGKFEDAKTFFTNLDTLASQVITDLGINASTRVRLILAVLGIGVRTIAALVREQVEVQPQLMADVRAAAPQTVERMMKLADPKTAEALLQASRP